MNVPEGIGPTGGLHGSYGAPEMVNTRQMALAERIADIYVGPKDQAPRVSYPSDWDKAFVKASRVGLDYAIQILTDKAETDCDNSKRYRDTITLLRDRIEYIAIHGYPVNAIDDEQIGWEIDRFQVWSMERDPEIQEVIRQTENDIAALAAEKGVSLDQAVALWNRRAS